MDKENLHIECNLTPPRCRTIASCGKHEVALEFIVEQNVLKVFFVMPVEKVYWILC